MIWSYREYSLTATSEATVIEFVSTTVGCGDAFGPAIDDVSVTADFLCVSDLSGDGIVDGADLGILLGQWGPATPATVSDINHDGVVDGADLGMLLGAWGPCPN